MELKVVELFAGVGGFRVGLNHINSIDSKTGKAKEKGDWNFVWANQFEPSTRTQHAFDCYKLRFGDDGCSNEDIHAVNKNEIPDHTLLVGGFPCQDYSVARSLSNEKGIEGKKGVLFWDIKDIIEAKHAPFILLENVDRLLKSPASRRGRDFAIMLKTFDALGYYVNWRVVNAADFGMPQRRRRVFIFAFKKDTKYAKSFLDKTDEELVRENLMIETFPIVDQEYKIKKVDLTKYQDAIEVTNSYKDGMFLKTGFLRDGVVYEFDMEDLVEPKFTLNKVISKCASYYTNEELEKYVVEGDKLEKWEYLKGSKKIERTAANGHTYIYSEGSMAFPDVLTEPARTMLTSEGTTNRSSHIIFDKKLNKYRILTPVECEMIQMFPANWTNTMPDKRRYFMMGNALVTGVISRLEPGLKKIIKDEE